MPRSSRQTRGRQAPSALLAGAMGAVTLALVIVLMLITPDETGRTAAEAVASEGRPPSVILVLLDTIRSDRLGCYGNPLGITPNIDAFARGAVRCERAFAQALWTLPAVGSIYTAQYPMQHGARGHLGAFGVLSDSVATIAEVLQRAGWSTTSMRI